MHRQELAGIPGRGRGVSYPALPIFGAKRTAANGIDERDRGVKPVSSEPGWIPRVFIAAQAELRKKLSLFRREVSLVPELILGASEALEIQVPFEEPEPRQHS